MEKIIIHGNVLAAGRAFLHIGSQREHLEFLIPCGIAPADPAEGLKTAIRHPHIEPFIRLIGPCVPKPHQFADGSLIRAISGIAAGKTADCRREPQRIGSAGIHPHPVPTDAHLHRVHGRIPSEVSVRCPADGLAVAAKQRGALVKLHPLRINI